MQATKTTVETTATRADALIRKATSSCVALRAMAAAIEANPDFGGCPVQAAIAADLYALADKHEAAEEATF